MKSYRYIIYTVCLVALSTSGNSSSIAHAMDSKLSRSTLIGLQRVGVLVDSVGPNIAEKGINVSQIKTDVELKLRTVGIEVFSNKDELLSEKGHPFIYVNINCLPEIGSDLYAYSARVELVQGAFLERNNLILAPTTTWSSSYLGIMKISGIRNNINNLMDRFLNAYLSANPK